MQGFKTTYPFLSGQAGADCRDVTLEQENFYALCQKKEQIDGTVSNLLACAATNLLFLCLMAEIGQGVVESLLRPGRKDGYITTSQVEQGKVFEIPEALQWTLKKYILDAEKGAYKQPGDRSETVEKFTKVIQGAVETLSPKDPKLKSKVLKIQRPGLLPATGVKGLELAAAFVLILGGFVGGALFSTEEDLSPAVVGTLAGWVLLRPMQDMLGRCCTNQSESLSSEGSLDSTSRSNELGFNETRELAKELTKKVLFVRYSSLTKLQKTSIINQINIIKDFSDDSIHKVTENIDKDVKQLDKKLDGLDQDGKKILVYTKDTVDDLNAKIEV